MNCVLNKGVFLVLKKTKLFSLFKKNKAFVKKNKGVFFKHFFKELHVKYSFKRRYKSFLKILKIFNKFCQKPAVLVLESVWK